MEGCVCFIDACVTLERAEHGASPGHMPARPPLLHRITPCVPPAPMPHGAQAPPGARPLSPT
eukprot:scaffold26267_cov109-Isochrysis_galbana.AAC.3